MSIGALDAAAAYSRALTALPGLDRIDPAERSAGSASVSPGVGVEEPNSFGSMIETMVGDTAATLHTAEAESAKQVAGKGDLIDVVTAVGAAETALNTIVAVRDRMVGAYAEIMRMQI